jgi:hypothetical protein
MACPDFEDLLREGPGGHASGCGECRALLEAAAEVDRTLELAFQDVSAPGRVSAAAYARIERLSRIPRPSLVPEILDFMGWAAVFAAAAVLIPRYLPEVIQALATRVG